MEHTLGVIERQTSRLGNLVRDLLLLSRIDLQVEQVPQTRCDVNLLVDEVLEEFAALAIASQVQLKRQGPEDSLWVWGDEEQLYGLLANLVANAIQYTPEAGTVTTRLQQHDGFIQIQVEDTGIGIPPDQQQRIFDRFYRVQGDRSRHTAAVPA